MLPAERENENVRISIVGEDFIPLARYLTTASFSVRTGRGRACARDVIANAEIASYLSDGGRYGRRRRRKTSAERWQHCRSERTFDRSRLWRGRSVERLLLAQRPARLVGGWRQPPDPDLCARARRCDRPGSASRRRWRCRSRQIDLSAAVVFGAADVFRLIAVRLRHGAFQRLRLARAGAAWPRQSALVCRGDRARHISADDPERPDRTGADRPAADIADHAGDRCAARAAVGIRPQ